jgi:hypothetical protein
MDRFLTKPPADSSSGSGSSSSSSSSSGGKKKKPKKSNTKNCEQILNDLMRSNPQPDTDGVHFNTFPPSAPAVAAAKQQQQQQRKKTEKIQNDRYKELRANIK